MLLMTSDTSDSPSRSPGSTLGVAASGDDDGVGISAAGGAEELPGLGVGGGCYGAGIQHHHVGSIEGSHHAIPGLAEAAGQRLAVGLVQLAAVGVYGDCARRGC